MAHVSRIAFFFMALAILALSATAQDNEFSPAPAPAPTIESVAGFPATFSGVFLLSSLLFSLAASLLY
ncbi:hypothetical protein L484_015262 [Morus notabilis]|uniref:Uncharacterized protein n=1 Tax=Morus notabilis TaxID=981085 RepID=W9RI79_9ROSA|nr:hypothetical protein L484_015262 [Morus notabilis]